MKRPLKLAYIIYIAVCIVYHIVTRILEVDFEMWNRIIVAVTIASYAFSFAGLPKASMRTTKKIRELNYEEKALVYRIAKEDVGGKFKEDIDGILHEINSEIDSMDKDIDKLEKWAFALDVLGFVSFFCVLSFIPLFEFFAQLQDFYTLLAFFLILLAEYVEDKFEDRLYRAKNKMLNTTERIELVEEQKKLEKNKTEE